MKRFIALAMIFTLIIGTDFRYILLANDKNNFTIEVDGDMTTEQTIVHIKTKESELVELNASLPGTTSVDKNLTSSLNDNLTINYNQNNRKVNIKDVDNFLPNRISIALEDVEPGINTIIISGKTNDTDLGETAIEFKIDSVEEYGESDQVKSEEEVDGDEVIEEAESPITEQSSEETEEEENKEKEKKKKQKDSSASIKKDTNNKEKKSGKQLKKDEKNSIQSNSSKDKADKHNENGDEDEVKEQKNNRINSDEKEPLITPFAGDLNADIAIESLKDKVESGKAAQYILTLKLTGSTRVTAYEDAKVTVNLPINDYTEFTQDLSQLTINDVEPTYNSTNHTLTYDFDTIETGKTYERIINVETKNGYTPNGTQLMASATFEGREMNKGGSGDTGTEPDVHYEDKATVTVQASGAISIDKKYTGRVWENNAWQQNVPVYTNRITEWEISVEVPKKDIGQMYLQEGSKVVITDTLPDGLVYESVGGEDTPLPVNTSNGRIVWEINASSLEQQEVAGETLYKATFVVWLRTRSNNAFANTVQTNEVDVEATWIDDSKLSDLSRDSIYISLSGSRLPPGDGEYLYGSHAGPTDGYGGTSYYGSYENYNPRPIVNDNALLRFDSEIHPMEWGAHADYESFNYIYNNDSNLILQEIVTPDEWVYFPYYSYYPEGTSYSLMERLSEHPQYDIYARVNNVRRLLVRNAQDGTHYTREDLGLQAGDTVTDIEFSFSKAPKGMMASQQVTYYFNVREGFTGTIENSHTITGVGFYAEQDRWGNPTGRLIREPFTINSKNLNDVWNNPPWFHPRQVQVVRDNDTTSPIATVGVSLEDNRGGEVAIGSNRMKVSLDNRTSSPVSMKESLETVVLLPPNVNPSGTLNESFTLIKEDGTEETVTGIYEILDDNYNNTGRQLVKFTWDHKFLHHGETLNAWIDVDVLESSATSLTFDVYGFSGDNVLRVPSSQSGSITDTVLQTDEGDLNDDGISDQPRLKSGNYYTIRGKYDLITEKWVKTDLIKNKNGNVIYDGTEWKKFHQIEPGADYQYKLDLKNTTHKIFEKMVLIDVLPSIGDLGITDNTDRGSQFTPMITGPITLPTEWEDKVTVHYSTATNPRRDDLTKNTIYPDSTTQLGNPTGAQNPNWMTEAQVSNDWSKIHSFKIELKDGYTIDPGEVAEIVFDMKAPDICDVPNEILNKKVDPKQRAAWNSFATATDHGQPVEPERVGIYMNGTGAIELEKVDENNNPIVTDTAIFQLFQKNVPVLDEHGFPVLDDNGEPVLEDKSIGVYDTDNNSLIQVDGLEYGDYYFIELVAPDGYQLNEGQHEFTIDGPASLTKDSCGDIERLKVINEEATSGEVKLEKYGEKDEDSIKKRLQGAEFSLYKKATSSDEDDELIEGGLTTNEQGIIQYTDLELADYYFIETKAPAGYALNNEKIEFTIDNTNNNETITLTAINYNVPEVEKDIEDEQHYEIDRDREFKYNITIKTPGDIDKYKILGVTDTLDERLEFIDEFSSITDGWMVTGTDKSNIEFTKVGQTLTWSVKDLTLLQPNTEITITFTAKIKPNAVLEPTETGIENEAVLEFDNDRGEFSDPEDPPTTPPVTVDPKDGGIKIIKIDASDNDIKLAGAEFKLSTDKAGNDIVDSTGTIITVNGEPHSGLLKELTTRTDGTFTIEGLTPGTYYLHETKAPTYTEQHADGSNVELSYRLLTKPLEVEVENKVLEKNYEVKNSKTGWQLPDTGGIGTILFYLLGAVLMVLAVLLFLKRNNNARG